VIRSAIETPRIAMQLRPVSTSVRGKETIMRGILLWAVGIPIPVIILLYLFHVI
jgi:hypothetical protein